MNYQKINIEIGPTLMEAELITDEVCECGMKCIKSEISIGTKYQVDLKSIRWVRYQCFGCGKTIELRVIDAWNSLLVAQWTFLDCLDIGQVIPIIKPEGKNWTTVKDNSLAPAHHCPGRIM
jgi:hypothetical protein